MGKTEFLGELSRGIPIVGVNCSQQISGGQPYIWTRFEHSKWVKNKILKFFYHNNKLTKNPAGSEITIELWFQGQSFVKMK